MKTGLLGALVALMTVTAAEAHAARTQLKIGLSGYPSTLHPAFSSELVGSYILGFAHRKFTAYDQDWKLVCMICETLPTLENGLAKRVDLGDGKTGIETSYVIQKDLYWDDGVPVTTADVELAIEVGQHEKTAAANKEFFERIVKLDILSDREFRLTTDRVDYNYNNISGLEVIPNHLEREIFEEDPATYEKRSLYVTAPGTKGLWHGPFRITRAVTGSAVLLEQNPHWKGQIPAFEKLQIRTFEKTAALDANLLSGEIDYAAGEVGMSLDQVLALEKRFGDRFHFSYVPGLYYAHVDLNLDNPVLQDVKVRRALLMAIDRQAISDKLFGGKNSPANSFVHPRDPAFSKSSPRVPYDPEQAKHLLAKAGWTDVRHGIRHNGAGEKLSLELRGATESSTGRKIQQVLQSQWKRVGIEVKLNNQPARVLFGESLPKRDFGDMAMFSWVSMPEHLPRTILYSDQVPSDANQRTGQNYTGYQSERMDALIDQIEVELSFEKRLKLWEKMQTLYATDIPVLPIYHGANGFVMPHWLKGVRPTGHLFLSTLWAEQWSTSE